MSDKNLAGKRALVTGAARGIGQATAIELAQRGADVAICDRLECVETLAAIHEFGVRALSERCDVGDRADVERVFQTAASRLGGLDILVNNAAGTVRKPLLELEIEDVAATWSASLWGVLHCTQLAGRMMARQGGGAVITISSVLASIPQVNSSPYNGAKAAVNQMTRTWALELARYGIRVNAIEPGWIDTPGERNFATEDQILAEGAKLPLGRLGRAREIAKAVAFLASDDASYITG
ncbi:MAG TPA: SDR family oxidoreductase, partial [Bryobacteraceae bacterium]|nr:SDR family oxidoreductase [Bryobacteraceae bacterium]